MVERKPGLGPRRRGWPPNGDTWCIVLAAGSGARLQELTTFGGRCIPKQYCAVGPGRSLLQRALQRARRLVPVERIVVVVDASHRRWWRRDLKDLPPENIVVQPCDRGTAPGLLLPLLRVTSRDANATVVVLPSDHHVADEWVLATAVRSALDEVATSPNSLQILGVQPEEPDPGLGWIVPSRRAEAMESIPVQAFREKPDPAELSRLIARGAAASTFILAARSRALIDAFEHTVPDLLTTFRRHSAGTAGNASLRQVYQDLVTTDFSRGVLEPLAATKQAVQLFLMRVPCCGWNDLGTPERIASCFQAPSSEASSLHSLIRPPTARAWTTRLEARRHGLQALA